MTMPVSTWVEVDLDRFAANLRAVRDSAVENGHRSQRHLLGEGVGQK